MRLISKLFSFACLAVFPVIANADFTQLPPGAFIPTSFGGDTSFQSVFDTGPVNAGELRNFSVAYDNFNTGGVASVLTSLTWVGKYLDVPSPLTPTTNTFHIDIFADNGSNRPANDIYNPSPLYSQVVTATETATGVFDGAGDQFYQYTATVPTVLLNGGTNYWLSILGTQPYGDNGFGWAFSPTNGDDVAIGDFQPAANASIIRFELGRDFAFNATITAVPEPSSCLLLAGAIGIISVRKLLARRKVSA